MNTSEPKKPDIDRFYIVDFDRTLADSDKLLEVFLEIADRYLEIPREQIEEANRQIQEKGDSFDTASYVRDHLSDQNELDKWQQLEKQFIHESRALNMLLPGASDLLQFLHEKKLRFGILTYGNPLWQRIKLTASGFNHVPRIITTHKHKSALITSWQQPDGTFHLPQEYGGGVAQAITLIDDKAVSFDVFPALPSQGYWVLDQDNALPSQRGTVPENVKNIRTLNNVIGELLGTDKTDNS